jgi:hypothetical protein
MDEAIFPNISDEELAGRQGVPLEIAFVLDRSGSMSSKQEE